MVLFKLGLKGFRSLQSAVTEFLRLSKTKNVYMLLGLEYYHCISVSKGPLICFRGITTVLLTETVVLLVL